MRFAFQNISDDAYIPCCRRCSCDAICHETGNCCPDVREPHFDYKLRSCQTVFEVVNGYKRLYRDPPTIIGRIIDSCPSHVMNSTLAALCTRRKELSDLVTTSCDRGFIYRNKHCAHCYGAMNLTFWDLGVVTTTDTTGTDTHFRSFAERNEFLINNGRLVSFPPESSTLPLDISDCHSHESQISLTMFVSFCNFTKLWDVYDSYLEHACNDANQDHINMLVYQTHRSSRLLIYSNPFCYLCNNPAVDPSAGMCLATAIDEAATTRVPEDKSMFLLLQLPGPRGVSYSKCKSFEVFDPFTVSLNLLIKMGCLTMKGSRFDGNAEILPSHIYSGRLY